MAEEPEKKPDSEYEHADSEREEIDQVKLPVEAEKPAANAKPSLAPASKSKHPAGLVRRALRFGAAQAAIDAASTDELDDWVERTEIEVEREREQAQRARSTDEAIDRTRTRPAAKAEPAVEEDELGLGELEKELDPRVVKFLKAQTERLKAAEGELKQATEREKVRQQRTTEELYDAAFAGLDKKYQKVFGDGDGREMPGTSKELRRRIAVLKESGIDVQNDSPASMRRKISKAAEELYGEILGQAAAEPKEDDAGAYSGVKPSQELTRKSKGNGTPRITKEQWDDGGLATPTHRASKEPKGRDRAIRAVAAQMKERGLTEDDMSGFEEDGLPE